MDQEMMIDNWKKGLIYPISKPVDWNKELAKTRPITLIETARKLMTKIITQRLMKVLQEKNILKGKNYAALKCNSTFELIRLISSLIEDANRFKKELWIILMDISKAFDSVSAEILKLCLI